MAWEPNPAAFLRAEDDIALQHFGANVFEADAGLDQFESMRGANLVHHRGGRERLDHPALGPAIDDKMLEQQADDLMRRQRITPAIHAADTVGVAVRHQTDIVGMLLEIRRGRAVVLGNRLGIDSAKIRIVIAVQRRHPATGAREQLSKATRPDAEESIVREAEFRAGNEFEINELLDGRVMRGPDIGDARCGSLPERSSDDRVSIQQRLDPLTHGRFSRAAEVRLEFEPVERRRIMAGRNHHAAHRLLRLHRVGNRRRGRGTIGQQNLKAVRKKNFCRAPGELVGKKTPVVTHHHLLLRPCDWIGGPIVRRRLRYARNIGKSEILRDDRTPAVRSEFDLSHEQSVSTDSNVRNFLVSSSPGRKLSFQNPTLPGCSETTAKSSSRSERR